MSAFMYKIFTRSLCSVNRKIAVLITGCDSGLGYSFARHCQEIGMTVFGCVHNENSVGAKDLKSKNNIHVIELEVTDKQSIKNLETNVKDIIASENHELIGIVNNAGVMVFGEFEWLTENQIENQIMVNFLGAVHLTKAFIPILRKHKGRIINVSSHCSIVPLPALSIYAATKSAIDAWSCSLAMELDKFGIKVITFTPGSYITQSRIMSKQDIFKEKMEQEMSSEAITIYKDYFERFHHYLKMIPREKGLTYIQDNVLISKFDHALLANNPNNAYVHSPMRYKFYHFLIRLSPSLNLRNFFIKKYVNLPEW